MGSSNPISDLPPISLSPYQIDCITATLAFADFQTSIEAAPDNLRDQVLPFPNWDFGELVVAFE